LTPIVVIGYRDTDCGSTIFGADDVKYRTHGSAIWPLEKEWTARTSSQVLSECETPMTITAVMGIMGRKKICRKKKKMLLCPCVNKNASSCNLGRVQISSIIKT
jgi:hypothetical protein